MYYEKGFSDRKGKQSQAKEAGGSTYAAVEGLGEGEYMVGCLWFVGGNFKAVPVSNCIQVAVSSSCKEGILMPVKKQRSVLI